jgi:hypothetical protein
VVHHHVNKEMCTVSVVFPLFCSSPVLRQWHFNFMMPDFAVFCEITPFLHGPCQTPIAVTLDLDFMLLQLYVFPEFAHHFFLVLAMKIYPNFTISSSVLTISNLR